MSVREYQPVEYDVDLQHQATNAGLVMPRLEIARGLVEQLNRRDRALEVDQFTLWSGTQDVELDTPLTVSIDSLSQDGSVNKPTLTFPSDDHSVIGVSHNPVAERGMNVAINEAFWLGIVVTDEVLKNKSNYEQRQSKAHRRTVNATLGVAGALLLELGDLEVAHATLPLDGSLLATLGLGAAGLIRLSRMRQSNIPDQLSQAKRHQAKALGKQYPVLSYGMSIPQE
jgi:hypothetical protein